VGREVPAGCRVSARRRCGVRTPSSRRRGGGPSAGEQRLVRSSAHQRETAGRNHEPGPTRPRTPGKRHRSQCMPRRPALSQCSRPPTAPRRPRSTGTTAPSTGARSLPQPRTVSPTALTRHIFGRLHLLPGEAQPSLNVSASQKLSQSHVS
jgi:hypothetical protein